MIYDFGYVLIKFSCIAAASLDVIVILFNNDNTRCLDRRSGFLARSYQSFGW
jgi:hypothetical protein